MALKAKRKRIPFTSSTIESDKAKIKVLLLKKKEKVNYRITSQMIKHMQEHGFNPMVTTDKLKKRINRVLYWLESEDAYKRFKKFDKQAKKQARKMGYCTYPEYNKKAAGEAA